MEDLRDAPANTRGVPSADTRDWVNGAIRAIRQDIESAQPTRLVDFGLPASWGVRLYVKCELEQPTGSLKHRLARALILDGLCNGMITADGGIVEASSGSTAISLALFADRIGLRMAAVMPESTSPRKISAISEAGAECILVPPGSSIEDRGRQVAADRGWTYLDQFSNASRVLDWRSHNLASEAFSQLAAIELAAPDWVVVGAGTGGTATTFGRYIRFMRLETKLCVVDPEMSVLYSAWVNDDLLREVTTNSRIEGIGRPRVPRSLNLGLIDRMIEVPDTGSIAMMQMCHRTRRLQVGPSTGTNLWGAIELAVQMRDAGISGTVLTVACDSSERYTETVLDGGWLAANGIDQPAITAHFAAERFAEVATVGDCLSRTP